MINRLGLGLLFACSYLCMLAVPCNAQVYVVGSPVYGPPAWGVNSASVIVQRPIVAPGVVVGAGHAEGISVGYAPYATFRPVVSATYVAPAPVVTYRPATPYATYSVPYTVPYTVPYIGARPVVVHPKVYVPGQPVRNVVRAVTP